LKSVLDITFGSLSLGLGATLHRYLEKLRIFNFHTLAKTKRVASILGVTVLLQKVGYGWFAIPKNFLTEIRGCFRKKRAEFGAGLSSNV